MPTQLYLSILSSSHWMADRRSAKQPRQHLDAKRLEAAKPLCVLCG